MKSYIAKRTLEIAHYVVETRCTVRNAGKKFCVSKSTVHKDLNERLPKLDKNLFCQVNAVLGENWNQRYLRGGMATKRKYALKR